MKVTHKKGEKITTANKKERKDLPFIKAGYLQWKEGLLSSLKIKEMIRPIFRESKDHNSCTD
jgi:hypothetical protein